MTDKEALRIATRAAKDWGIKRPKVRMEGKMVMIELDYSGTKGFFPLWMAQHYIAQRKEQKK